MLYLHDVWVNWFEEEEHDFNVCHYHEWRKSDGMELLDQVPVVLLRPDAMTCLEQSLEDIPQTLIRKVENKAFTRKGSKRETIACCFVASDGDRTMAIDTKGGCVPLKKSRIMPQHDRIVKEMADCHAKETILFPERQKRPYSFSHPAPNWMTGLTRKERELKQLLLLAVEHVIESHHEPALKYWLTEWKPADYRLICAMTADQAARFFAETIVKGWSADHERLCAQMVKGRPYLQKRYEQEISLHTASTV